jgi:hypothetical protein
VWVCGFGWLAGWLTVRLAGWLAEGKTFGFDNTYVFKRKTRMFPYS